MLDRLALGRVVNVAILHPVAVVVLAAFHASLSRGGRGFGGRSFLSFDGASLVAALRAPAFGATVPTRVHGLSQRDVAQ